MTEKVNPSANIAAEAFKTAGAIAQAEGDGYIVGQNNPTDIVIQDGDLLEDNMSEFAQTSGANNLSVTIEPGEAFVYGAWLAIDVESTVDLNASQNNQEVFLGWNKNGANDVVIGKNAAFSNSVNNSDPRIKIWEFDTDSSGVTAARDHRTIGRAINVEYDGTTTIGRNDTLNVHDNDANLDVSIDGNLDIMGSLSDSDTELTVGANDSESLVLNQVYDSGPSGRAQVRADSEDNRSEMVMARVGAQSMADEEIGRIVWQSTTAGGTQNSVASIETHMIEDQPSGDSAGAARLNIDAPLKSFGEWGWPVYTESTHQGHGHYFGSVDAVYDNDTGEWRARSGYSSPHAGIGFVNHYPGEGISSGNIAFAAAPETTSEGEIVEWREMTFRDDGVLSMKDGGVEFTGVTTPTSPDNGWVVYTDSEDGRLKARDSDGNVTTLAT